MSPILRGSVMPVVTRCARLDTWHIPCWRRPSTMEVWGVYRVAPKYPEALVSIPMFRNKVLVMSHPVPLVKHNPDYTFEFRQGLTSPSNFICSRRF
jgi:hypothetical protein